MVKRGLAPVHCPTLRLTDCWNRAKLWMATRSLWIGGSSMASKMPTRWILLIASSTTTTTKLCLALIVVIFWWQYKIYCILNFDRYIDDIRWWYVKPLWLKKNQCSVFWNCNCSPQIGHPTRQKPWLRLQVLKRTPTFSNCTSMALFFQASSYGMWNLDVKWC